MKLLRLVTIMTIFVVWLNGCGKKKYTGDVVASLMKTKTVSSTSLNLASESGLKLTDSGSMVQSFTPTSLKIAIFHVSLCRGGVFLFFFI